MRRLLLLATAAAVAVARAEIAVLGTSARFANADFFHASAQYDVVSSAPLRVVALAAGCVPQAGTGAEGGVVLFQFKAAEAAGCASFGSIIETPEFAALAPDVAVFAFPATAGWEPGWQDMLGVVARYVDRGHALTMISYDDGVALEALYDTHNASLLVTVTSDEGNWVRLARSPAYVALRVLTCLIAGGFALLSLAVNVLNMSVEERRYRVLQYNNAIYWLLFFGTFFMFIEAAIDYGGYDGRLSFGQFFTLRFTSYFCLMFMISLLLSAWVRVVASVPQGALGWMSAGARAFVPISFVVFVVLLAFADVNFFTLEHGTPIAELSNVSFTIVGVLILLMCLCFIGFGGWLLHRLSAFSKIAPHNVAMIYKITVLMIMTALCLLTFVALLAVMSFAFVTPVLFMIFTYLQLFFLTGIFATVVASLRINAFHFSTKQTNSVQGATDSSAGKMGSDRGEPEQTVSALLTLRDAEGALTSSDIIIRSLHAPDADSPTDAAAPPATADDALSLRSQ